MMARIFYFMVAVLWTVSLIACASAFVGCGPSLVHADKNVDMQVKKGPPCEIIVSADGEVVSTVIGPKKCNVEVSSD